MPRRTWLFATAALAVVVAVAVATALAAPSPRFDRSGAVYRLERGDEAYVFDAAWRVESVWVRVSSGTGWARLADPDPDQVASLRRALLLRIGRTTLADIPAEGADEMRAMRALGYI
jgi:hypothetical protein